MVDNFDKFKSINIDKGEFIFVQILQRAKDNPDIGANNKLIKYYCVDDYDYLLKHKSEIIKLCDSLNARAYIHYTPRSYHDVHVEMLHNLGVRLKSEQSNRGLRNAFPSASGNVFVKEKKTWVIDIDDIKDRREINDILLYIERECKPFGVKYVNLIETKNGVHLITKPFDLKTFKEKYPNVNVHKNNPTILYVK